MYRCKVWTRIILLCVGLFSVLIAVGSEQTFAQSPSGPTSVAANGTIAYAVNGKEIWLMDGDGSNKRRIWQAPAETAIGINSLDWSPDGSKIAFASGHEALCSLWPMDLYTIGSDGSGLRRVTNGPACAELAGYPKGSVTFEVENKLASDSYQIVMEGSDGYPIYLFNNEVKQVTINNVADLGDGVIQYAAAGWANRRWWKLGVGGDIVAGQTVDLGRLVIDDTFFEYSVSHPSWSPNAAQIGFLSASGLPYLVDASPPPLNRGTPLLGNLGDGVSVAATGIDWAPTGNEVLYSLADFTQPGIYRATVGGNSPGAKVAVDVEAQSEVTWLPDGSGFVFTKAPWGTIYKNLYSYAFANNLETQLTSVEADFFSPSVSPDGQKIAFEVRNSQNVTKMGVVNRDGTNLLILDDNGRAPAWGPAASANPTATPTATATSPGATNTPTATATSPGATNTPTATATTPKPCTMQGASQPAGFAADGGPRPGPAPHFTGSGAAGAPATFSLPAGRLPQVEAAIAQSVDDWTADFTDDFESGLGAAWEVLDNSDDGQERSWGIDTYYANSPSHAVWVAAGGADALDPAEYYYPADLDSWLVTTNPLDLSKAQAASVDFAMLADIEAQNDYVFVGVSLDGQSFSGEYWTGSSGGWQEYSLDLSEYAGYSQVYVAWLFHSSANENTQYEGVWLDDIGIWTYVDSGPVTGSNGVQNGDFESGDLCGWTLPSAARVAIASAANPTGGNYVAKLGGAANVQEKLSQTVQLPGGAVSSARIGFYLNSFGNETSAGKDQFCSGIYDSNLSTLLIDLGCMDGTEVFGSQFDAAGWQEVDYPLSGAEWESVQGKSVNVVFEMITDGQKDTTVYVDNVVLETATGGAPSDDNNSASSATPATLGTAMTGLVIDPDNDEDWFSFSGNAGQTVTVDVDAAVNGSQLDSYIYVVNGSNSVLCENDDDSNSSDSYVACPLTATGTYYVVVTSYDGSGDRSYTYGVTIKTGTGAQSTPTPPPAPAVTPTPPAGQGKRVWTAILYMDGDNNLCDSFPPLIERLGTELNAKLGANGFLNVTVLVDRLGQHCNGDSSSTRYVIQPNGAYTANMNRWDMGELNMGDPKTFVNFVKWSMQNYPADHYYLAMDDHGGGITGISWDDTSAGDNITASELYAAMKEITNNGQTKIDVFAYEACLMEMYENLYDLRDFTHYVFGFPTISWTNSASYPSYLSDSRFTAATSGRALGDIIFDVYFNAVQNPYTVSLVETNKINALHTAVNAWASALQSKIGSSQAAIAQARSNAVKIDADGNDTQDESDYYLDLWSLADQMAAQGVAVAESNAVKAAVTAAVVRTDYRPGTAQVSVDYSKAHGISIYWPRTASGSYSEYVGGQLFNATRNGTWDDFLQAYLGGGARRGMPATYGAIDRRPASSGFTIYLPMTVK